ncbi:Panacea domain-containing protein [Shewanella baltica]|uniref:Panacea domain-containing protein n=1 Tax=Shewanella baltica TaxID=62322 RepID=UPI003D792EFF
MLSSTNFSQALLYRAHHKGINLCNLKLQKLAYYCQGYYLATHNEPLFHDVINAWQHGPVVPTLYHSFCGYGDRHIPVPAQDHFSSLAQSAKEMIDFIIDKYGRAGAWTLRNNTHNESPWLAHYDRDSGRIDKAEITHQELKSFFLNELAEIQDKQLAKLLDQYQEASTKPPVAMPDTISSSNDFLQWIRNR